MSDNSDNTSTRSTGIDVEPMAALHSSSPLSSKNYFNKLPFETIGEIFIYADPVINLPATPIMRKSRNSETDPWTISAVCKQWDAITLLNPSLWATITMNATRAMRSDWEEWGFSQLRSCLERSGAHPLDIRINANDTGPYFGWAYSYDEILKNDNVLLHEVLDVVMLHSERWQRIAFIFPWQPEYSARFDTFDGRLPLLEHLEINASKTLSVEKLPTCTGFLSSPQLKSVCVNPSHGTDVLRKILMPKTQISDVIVSNGEFEDQNDLREMLGLLSVSLKSLTFSHPIKMRSLPSSVDNAGQITLTHLRRLSFTLECDAVLEMLICPSLEDLETVNAPEDLIIQFLTRSSCALTHLKLISPTPNVLRHKSLSTLKSFSLPIFDELTLDLLNFDSHHLFPSLKNLGLYLHFERGNDGGAAYLRSQVQGLREMVDSRTRPMEANQPGSHVDGLRSDKFQQKSRSSFNQIICVFNLERGVPDEEDYWDVEPIQALQAFCVSRGVLISLKIDYW